MDASDAALRSVFRSVFGFGIAFGSKRVSALRALVRGPSPPLGPRTSLPFLPAAVFFFLLLFFRFPRRLRRVGRGRVGGALGARAVGASGARASARRGRRVGLIGRRRVSAGPRPTSDRSFPSVPRGGVVDRRLRPLLLLRRRRVDGRRRRPLRALPRLRGGTPSAWATRTRAASGAGRARRRGARRTRAARRTPSLFFHLFPEIETRVLETRRRDASSISPARGTIPPVGRIKIPPPKKNHRRSARLARTPPPRTWTLARSSAAR